jgi:hypothetical protein
MSKLLEKYNNSPFVDVGKKGKFEDLTLKSITPVLETPNNEDLLKKKSVFSNIRFDDVSTVLIQNSVFGKVLVNPMPSLEKLYENMKTNRPVYIGFQSKLLTLNSSFDDLQGLKYSNVLDKPTQSVIIAPGEPILGIYSTSKISKSIPGTVNFIPDVYASGFTLFAQQGVSLFDEKRLPPIMQMNENPEKTMATINPMTTSPKKNAAITNVMPTTPVKPVATTQPIPATPEKPVAKLGQMTNDEKKGRDYVPMPTTPEKPVATTQQMPVTPEKHVATLGMMTDKPKSLKDLAISNAFSDYFASGFTKNMAQGSTEYHFEKLDEVRKLVAPTPTQIQPTNFEATPVDFFGDDNAVGFILNAPQGKTFYIMDKLPKLNVVDFFPNEYATGFTANEKGSRFNLDKIGNVKTPVDRFDEKRDTPKVLYDLANGKYTYKAVNFISDINAKGFTINASPKETQFNLDSIPETGKIGEVNFISDDNAFGFTKNAKNLETKFKNIDTLFKSPSVDFIKNDFATGFDKNASIGITKFNLSKIDTDALPLSKQKEVNFISDDNAFGFTKNAKNLETKFRNINAIFTATGVNFIPDDYATGFDLNSEFLTTKFILSKIGNFKSSTTDALLRDDKEYTSGEMKYSDYAGKSAIDKFIINAKKLTDTMYDTSKLESIKNSYDKPIVIGLYKPDPAVNRNDAVPSFTTFGGADKQDISKFVEKGKLDKFNVNSPFMISIYDVNKKNPSLNLANAESSVFNRTEVEYTIGNLKYLDFAKSDSLKKFIVKAPKATDTMYDKTKLANISNSKTNPLELKEQTKYITNKFFGTSDIVSSRKVLRPSFYIGMDSDEPSRTVVSDKGDIKGFVFALRGGVLLQQPIITARDGLSSASDLKVAGINLNNIGFGNLNSVRLGEMSAELTYTIATGRDMNLYNMIASTGIFNTVKLPEDKAIFLRAPKSSIRLENDLIAIGITKGSTLIENLFDEEGLNSELYDSTDPIDQNFNRVLSPNGLKAAGRILKIYTNVQEFFADNKWDVDVLGRGENSPDKVTLSKNLDNIYPDVANRIDSVNRIDYIESKLKKLSNALKDLSKSTSKLKDLNNYVKDLSIQSTIKTITIESEKKDVKNVDVLEDLNYTQKLRRQRNVNGLAKPLSDNAPGEPSFPVFNEDKARSKDHYTEAYFDGKNARPIEIIDEKADDSTGIKFFKYDNDLIDFYFEDISSFSGNSKNATPQTSIVIPFRAIITNYSDDVSSQWDSFRYIGRPDPIFKYGGFDRNVNIAFDVVANSAAELIPMWQKINYLYGMCYPVAYPKSVAMKPPIMRITVGNLLQRVYAIMKSINFSVNKDSIWEIEKGKQLPMYINIQTSFAIIYDDIPLAQSHHFSQIQLSNTFAGITFDAKTGLPVRNYIMNEETINPSSKNQNVKDEKMPVSKEANFDNFGNAMW